MDLMKLTPYPTDSSFFVYKGKRLSRTETVGIAVTRDLKPGKIVKFTIDDGFGCIPCVLWLNQLNSPYFYQLRPADVRLIAQQVTKFASNVQVSPLESVVGSPVTEGPFFLESVVGSPNSPPFSNCSCPNRKMIKLFKVKEKQKELAENANGKPPVKKQSAGELRLHKDISELNLPKTCTISFPNGKDDLMNFEVTIRPDEGYYMNGTFVFSFQISPIYPHDAPKVKCKTKVYHPNIDLEGNVCLNILREDWKPVLSINTIIYGLFHLFTEPNHEDPLNPDAASVLRDNPKLFESNVKRAMAGGYVGQTFFPRCL